MRWVLLVAAAVFVLGVGRASPAEGKGAGARQAGPKFDAIVKIEFPKDGYTCTLAEAAKGIKLQYKIIVAQDYAGVIALPSEPSFQEPPGPSGLHPRERISGKGQLYCLLDFGRGAPPQEVAKTLKKGSYLHSFDWDGRNWNGPSDFNNPKGKPFPAGTYVVTVALHGKLVSGKDNTPYQITHTTKLVLK